MLKRVLIVLGVIIVLLLGIYILPNFITINEEKKSYIEQEIEKLVKFDIEIKGKVVFSILPYPAIVLKNVDFKALDTKEENKVFLNAKQIFVSMSLFDIMKGDIKIDKIVIDNGYLNYGVYKEIGFSNLDLFLKGENFKHLIMKDCVLTQTDFKDNNDNKIRRIYDINMNFSTESTGTIKGEGELKYLSNTVDDIDFKLKYLDKKNYDLKIDFDYINGENDIASQLNLIMKDGEYIFNGNIDLTSENLYKFVPLIDSNLSIPNIGLFNEKINIKSTIQTTPEAIILSNGSISSNENFGTFSGIIPYNIDENNKLKIQKENILISVDFKNLRLDKILKLPRNIFDEDITQIDSFKDIVELLKLSNWKITAKNIFFKNNISNLSFESAREMNEQKEIEGITIKNLNYNIGQNSFTGSGKLNKLNEDIEYEAKIKTNISFLYPNKIFKMTKVNNLEGNISKKSDKLKMNISNLEIGTSKFSGDIEKSRNSTGKDKYDIRIKSDKMSSNSFTKEKVNLSYIINKLSLLKDKEISIRALIKTMLLDKEKYEYVKLNTRFINDTLTVNKLTFNNGGYSSDIQGDLIDITGQEGEFRNFNYVITSKDLKGLSLPFVKNNFIDKLISNGVNKLDIKLNGDANNPKANVYAELNNIKVEVNGNLLEGQEKYTLNLTHNELKGFLFSWGIIDNSLMNYLYDDIPFSITGEVDGNNINNMIIKIKDNTFTGNIINENISSNKKEKEYETTINLTIDNLDIRSILKRLKTTDLYIDFILKVIRGMKYNINLKATNITEYDGNKYDEVNLNLSNAQNPGEIKFQLKEGKKEVNLISEILNKTIFNGILTVKEFNLPKDLMNNELLNLVKGILDIELKFRSNGENYYDLTSNLTGSFESNIKDGEIKGISDYDTILVNISQLANITTNNVIYILENSFKSGEMEFDSLKINGNIENANIEKSAFELKSNNIQVTGFITGNLIQKSLNIESVFDIKNLAPDTISVIYNLTGYINNLSGDVNTSNLTSKINSSYLIKRIKELKEVLSNN